MTQEEKRIKLAEAAGFTDIMLPMGFHQQMSDEKSKECGGRWRFEIPNYFEDLNAVHELEKILNAGQINTYLSKLYAYTKLAKVGANPWEIISVRVAVHATAAERCEAIGLTLNLW